jgi:hypothetical protein
MKSDQYAARLAGFMFLFLIATVLASSFLLSGVEEPEISNTFRNISQDIFRIRLSTYLLIVSSISTLILATMLYIITKRQDENLAILALLCRATEAALYAMGITSVFALLFLSEGIATASENELASARVLGELVSSVENLSTNIGAIFFAVGSTLYSYLFFKARSIPAPLAGLGLVASLMLVVGVPLQTAAGHSTVAGASAAIWIPMFVFEISTGSWLLIKGAKMPHLEHAEQILAAN